MGISNINIVYNTRYYFFETSHRATPTVQEDMYFYKKKPLVNFFFFILVQARTSRVTGMCVAFRQLFLAIDLRLAYKNGFAYRHSFQGRKHALP